MREVLALSGFPWRFNNQLYISWFNMLLPNHRYAIACAYIEMQMVMK